MTDHKIAIVIDANGNSAIAAFDATTKSVVDLTQVIEKLSDKTEDSGKKVAATADQAETAGKKWENAGKAIGAGIAVAVTATAALIGRQINAADAAGKLADKLGVSTEFITQMGFAAKSAGSNQQTLNDALELLSVNAGKYAEGAEKQVKVFNSLGVSALDVHGRVKPLDVLLPQLADSFAKIEDPARRAERAQALFGSAGLALLPMLSKGSAGLADWAQKANELGMTISGDTAARAAQFKDRLDELLAIITGIGNVLAAELLPVLDSLAELLVDNANDAADLDVIARQLATGLKIAATAAAGIATAFQIVGRFIGAVMATMGDSITVVRSSAAAMASYFDSVSRAQRGDILGAFQAINQGVDENVEKARAALQRISATRKDFFTDATTEWNKLRATWSAIWDDGPKKQTFADYERWLEGAIEEADRAARSQQAVGNSFRATSEDAREAAEAQKELEDAQREGRDAADALRQEMGDLAAELEGPVAVAQRNYEQQLQRISELEEGRFLNAREAEQMRQTLRRQLEAERDATAELIDELEFERELIGLSNEDREVAIKLRQLEAGATDEQRDAVERLVRQIHAESEANELAQANAAERMRIWDSFADGMGDSITTAIFDGFEDGADRAMDVMKQLARDLVRHWAQQNIIIPMQARMSGQTGNFGSFGPMTNGQYSGDNRNFGSSVFGDAAGRWAGGNTGMAAAGNYASAAQSAYQVYDISRNGPGGWDGAAQGAMAGAAAGTAIMPGIGTLIGAVVGLLAGYFGGGPPTIRVADKERDATASSRLDSVIGVARDRMPEGTATAFANGIAQFDNAIAGLLDRFEGGAEQIQEIRTALANWRIRVEGDAATVENVLNQRFSAMLATFDESVQEYVGNSGKVEERVQRLADALFLAQAVGSENALVEDFEMLGRILGDYRIGTEDLQGTYTRVATATAMLEEALGLMGQSLDLGREDFIRFAADIGVAAGGAERAFELWAAYFDMFYTDTERLTRDLGAASSAAASELEDIGLSLGDFSGPEGMQRFREMFEQQLPNLTAAQIAAWLEAAKALGIYVNLSEQAAAAEAERAAAVREIIAGLASDAEGLQAAVAEFGLSAFAREQARIARENSAAYAQAVAAGATATELLELSLVGLSRSMAAARLAALEFGAQLEEWSFEDSLADMTEQEQAVARSNRVWSQRYRDAVEIFGEGSAEAIEVLRLWGRETERLTEDTEEAAAATENLSQAVRSYTGNLVSARGSIQQILQEARLGVRGDGLTERQRAIAELNQRFDGYEQALRDSLDGVFANPTARAQLEEQVNAGLIELAALRLEALANLEREHQDDITDALDERYEAERRWILSLADLRDSLLLDEQVSPLTPQQRLAEARRQYEEALGGAESGDEDARARFEGAARAYASELRSFFGSTDSYTEAFAQILADIQSLIDASPATAAADAAGALLGTAGAPPPTGADATAGATAAAIAVSPVTEQLVALRTESREGFARVSAELGSVQNLLVDIAASSAAVPPALQAIADRQVERTNR